MEKRYSLFLSLLLTAFIAANFFYFSNDVNAKKEKAVVARVIDGDTLELNDNRTIRLLNINAPEKKDPNSNLAANYLKKFQNKTIQLEPIGTDKYHRLLARLFYDNLYLNFDLTSKGLVSKYLVQKNEKSKFARAEREAIEK